MFRAKVKISESDLPDQQADYGWEVLIRNWSREATVRVAVQLSKQTRKFQVESKT